MKIAPLTRYSGAVGSLIVSEVAVSTGLRPEAWAGASGPLIGTAARIRRGVQKRRTAASWEAIEIEGIAAPAAGAISAATASAPARRREKERRGWCIRKGTQAEE